MATIKEQIVKLCQSQGYDFFQSCEMVTTILTELKAKKTGQYNYNIGKVSFTLVKT